MLVHPAPPTLQEASIRTAAKVAAALAAAFYLVIGIWAFVAPESFAENIARYPPYNEHLVHDGARSRLGSV